MRGEAGESSDFPHRNKVFNSTVWRSNPPASRPKHVAEDHQAMIVHRTHLRIDLFLRCLRKTTDTSINTPHRRESSHRGIVVVNVLITLC